MQRQYVMPDDQHWCASWGARIWPARLMGGSANAIHVRRPRFLNRLNHWYSRTAHLFMRLPIYQEGLNVPR